MEFFLAIDAGSSAAECWLADEHQVLARVSGKAMKLSQEDGVDASARLRQLLEDASGRAGVPLDIITRSCMGLESNSGGDSRAWVETTLRKLVSGSVVLAEVEEIALRAAFDEGPGVLVIADRGSQVVGRCANGARMSAGGWGPMLGDEGSGHWIGIEAIRSALRARDRGVPSALLKEINSFWGVESVGALLSKANTRPRPDFSALAEVVATCAGRGDALASSVLERAGEELAAQVGVVFSKMAAAGCAPGNTHRVAFTGDVLVKAPMVLREMRRVLQRLHPATEVDTTPVQPVEGALARARQG